MFAVKRALKLNNAEATLMGKHAGFRRVVYNFGLSLRTQMYGESKISDTKVIGSIKKVLTNHVKKRPEFAWMGELSSKVYQSALADLQDAFSRYRKGLAGHPTFASRKDGQSFTVYDSNGKVLIKAGNHIKIPTLGTFRLHEPLEVRLFDCPACRMVKDRDLNAAINILNWNPRLEGGSLLILGSADTPIAQEVNINRQLCLALS